MTTIPSVSYKSSSVETTLAPLTFYEQVGQSLQKIALDCIAPIDCAVACSMRAFSTAILPGHFGNAPYAWMEMAFRVSQVSLAVLSLPVTLTAFAVGSAIEQVGEWLHQRPYYYLQGQLAEKKTEDSSSPQNFTVFSANLCMLPYGISYLGGVRSASQRMDLTAKVICKVDADFVCLQEMSTPNALDLWEKIAHRYAHGFTRIGPMPLNRMEGSLFLASKYPILEIRYYPLPNEGPIARGVVCVKTVAGWMLNTHLSQGENTADLRTQQMEVTAHLCEELSEKGKIPCTVFMDSNILRSASQDEYSKCAPLSNFIEGFAVEEPFVLTQDNATCTNCLKVAIQGKLDPIAIEEKFEWVDHALVYKPCARSVSLQTDLIRAYDLQAREEALSDHHILYSKVKCFV